MRFLYSISFLFLSSVCLNAQPLEEFKAKAVSSPKPLEATGNTLSGNSALSILSHEISSLFAAKSGSVVKVIGTQKNQTTEGLLFGSGFFADEEGHVITTATVVTNTETVWIEYQGLSYATEIVGQDSTTNIAVLKLIKKPAKFEHVNIDPCSAYKAEPVGELVLQVGCMSGMEPSPQFGMLTGENITFGDRSFAVTYLRSSIHMCGGESGSPVFSSNGNLCGILIASIPELQSSFILPACALSKVFREIVHNQKVSYCSAGFTAQDELHENSPVVVVTSVQENGSASRAGLKKGDIIESIDNKPIKMVGDIANLLFFRVPGNGLAVKVKGEKGPESKSIILSPRTI